VKTSQQYVALEFRFPSPSPPGKTTSTSYPKKSPHPWQVSHHQCADPRIDSLDSPHLESKYNGPLHKNSHPKAASDRVLTPSRARISSPLATAREQRPYHTPNWNVTYVIRGSRSWSHQEPHPSKQAGANIPPRSAIRPRARAMGQGYPLTGPSPGATPPIYPSSLPLACGSRLSNIFPKSHCLLQLLDVPKTHTVHDNARFSVLQIMTPTNFFVL
jgi:hypothetical protein